jgi:hypothetical protein
MSGDYSSFNRLKDHTAHAKKHNSLQGHGGLGPMVLHYLINNGVARVDALPLGERLLCHKATEAHKANPNSPLIGVEIEVENYGHFKEQFRDSDTNLFNFYWITQQDGSLRNNGKEFVTRLGLSAAMLPDALDIFTKLVKAQEPEGMEVNARTGLHVHLNVAGLSQYQLSNLLFLYGIFEPLFFKVSGERKNSIFCVPWEFNRYTLGHIIYMLANDPLRFRWRNYSKYCGLNISTVETYGTLEFRMHEGSTDEKVIQKWVNTLINLYNAALSTDLITNVVNFRTERHAWKYRQLLNQIFAEYLPDIEANENENIARCVYATLGVYKGFVDRVKLPEMPSKHEQLANNVGFEVPDYWLEIQPEEEPQPRVPAIVGNNLEELDDVWRRVQQRIR